MLSFLAETIITPLLPFLLSFTALFFLIRLRFFPIVKFKTVVRSLFDKDNTKDSFRALSVALAGTLGVGNIIGVAYAVKEGGAGVLFWLWISAFFAAVLKYAETVLALKHRITVKERGNRQTVGGAMYYIPHKIPAHLFAIFCLLSSFTVGNLLQIGSLGEAIAAFPFSPSPIVLGLFLSVITFVIIRRGITRIGKFCAAMIPFLSAVYFLMCFAVLFHERALLPSIFRDVFKEAFSLDAFGNGTRGSVMFHAARIGFSKGLITNEAGCGTAPIAHASSDIDSPVKQGFLGMAEVFFDTVVLCSASALVVLTVLDRYPDKNGYSLIEVAFAPVFGKLGGVLLTLSLFLFVLATLVGWSYYGKSALSFLTKSKPIASLYLLLFSLTALFGALGSPKIFWTLSDITLGLMTIVNLFYLFVFQKEIQNETDRFFKEKAEQ